MPTDVLEGGWSKVFNGDPKQFDMFFDEMLDGFAYHEIVVDKAGKPIDYVFLEVNHAFEKMTGLKKEKILGRKVTEVLPGIEKDSANWIGVYGKVALTGKPVQFENHAVPLGKWYKVSAYSPKRNYFVAVFEDITERKKAEEALKEKEKRLNISQEIAHLGSWELDVVKDQLTWSDEVYRIFGLKPQEFGATYEAFLEAVHPEDRKKVDEAYSGSLREGRDTYEVEHRVVRKTTGEVRFVHEKCEHIRDSSGKIIKSVGMVQDITEQKKAEALILKAKEQTDFDRKRLETILETIPSAVVIVENPDGKISYINKRALELYGFDVRGLDLETQAQKLKVKMPNDKRALVDDLPATRSLRGEMVRNEELTIKRANSRFFPILASSAPLYGAQGKVVSAVVIFEDITERKQIERKLQEYGQNLEKLVEDRTKKLELSSLYARNLIEASLDPLVTISVEGKITDVNKATEIVTDCSREQLIGSDFSDYFTEPEKANSGYKQVFKEGFVRDYPLAIRSESGKITNVLYNAAIYKNEAGEIQGIFAAARDITELQKAEEQATESAKKLKDAERLAAIGATAGMVGHDIRNPLQAITGDLYLAKTDLASIPESEEKQSIQESLTAIEKNVDYINKIVQDLQDYARPLNPKAEENDLKVIIAKLFEKNSWPDNIELSVKVENSAKKITTDAYYINRIMYNLITNAVQAMPNGGKLTIHAFQDPKDIVLIVKDTGVGISNDVQGKLFTLMFTTKAKGQGFGLPVVKRMTEALGGTVTFESQEGKGTAFTVRLPLTR
jgi:PAS domain S-box-containing protein